MNKTKLVVATLIAMAAAGASATPFTVDAFSNSSSGGAGLDTGIALTAGQAFTVTVDPNDLWSAGALPRWSNADGLTGDRFATGSDESGEAAGTLIGINFGLLNLNGLSAPYGELVGEIGGIFFAIGSDFSGFAPTAGVLSLFYWDSNNFDNTGAISAEVNAVPRASVPEPFMLSLLGLGLLGMGAVRRRR